MSIAKTQNSTELTPDQQLRAHLLGAANSGLHKTDALSPISSALFSLFEGVARFFCGLAGYATYSFAGRVVLIKADDLRNKLALSPDVELSPENVLRLVSTLVTLRLAALQAQNKQSSLPAELGLSHKDITTTYKDQLEAAWLSILEDIDLKDDWLKWLEDSKKSDPENREAWEYFSDDRNKVRLLSSERPADVLKAKFLGGDATTGEALDHKVGHGFLIWTICDRVQRESQKALALLKAPVEANS